MTINYCIAPIYAEVNNNFIKTLPFNLRPAYIQLNTDVFKHSQYKCLKTRGCYNNFVSEFSQDIELDKASASLIMANTINNLQLLYPGSNQSQLYGISQSKPSYFFNNGQIIHCSGDITVNNNIEIVFEECNSKNKLALHLPLEGKEQYFFHSKAIEIYLQKNLYFSTVEIPQAMLYQWKSLNYHSIKIVYSFGNIKKTIEKKLDQLNYSQNPILENFAIPFAAEIRQSTITMKLYIVKDELSTLVDIAEFSNKQFRWILLKNKDSKDCQYKLDLIWHTPDLKPNLWQKQQQISQIQPITQPYLESYNITDSSIKLAQTIIQDIISEVDKIPSLEKAGIYLVFPDNHSVLFYGVFRSYDIEVIKKHNGPKYVFWYDNDANVNYSNRRDTLKEISEIADVNICNTMLVEKYLQIMNINYKKVEF